jgi:hypothetical protein
LIHPDGVIRLQNNKDHMTGAVNRGLPIARLLMVVSSFAPLFILWAIRGAPPFPDRFWIVTCLVLAIFPNLVLLWRWRIAQRRNDHRVIVVAAARDQSDHLLVYLFAMLLPLYAANLANERELAAVAVAFVFIVFVFWHMNLHYMNVGFALLGYRVYTIDIVSGSGVPGNSVILLTKRRVPPPAGTSIDGTRISDTVFVERETTDVG